MVLPIGAKTNIDAELVKLKRDVVRILVYAGLADALIHGGGIFLVNGAIVTFFRPFAMMTWFIAPLGIACTYLIARVPRSRSGSGCALRPRDIQANPLRIPV